MCCLSFTKWPCSDFGTKMSYITNLIFKISSEQMSEQNDKCILARVVAKSILIINFEVWKEKKVKETHSFQIVSYFHFTLQKEKGIVEDACYFIKFALGSYGWPLYVYMNPCSGPWNLCGHIRWVCLSTSLWKVSIVAWHWWRKNWKVFQSSKKLWKSSQYILHD